MFTFEEYLIGWIVYLVFTTGVLAVFWWLTQAIQWVCGKEVLRLTVSAILLAPVKVPGTEAYWAPAWVVGALELIFNGLQAFFEVGQILLIAVALALFIYCICVSLLWFYRAKFPS